MVGRVHLRLDHHDDHLVVDRLTISRADGSTTAIPDGSLAISGLTAATTYYFYPYYDEAALAIGWVAGGASSAGSPANAFTAKTNSSAQQQSLQSRIPLSQGAVVAATTSSGTGGGSGGGSGSCLRAGTVVLTKERGTVAIESCKMGEHLRCPDSARRRNHRRYQRLEQRRRAMGGTAKAGRASFATKCATPTRSSACTFQMAKCST